LHAAQSEYAEVEILRYTMRKLNSPLASPMIKNKQEADRVVDAVMRIPEQGV